MKTYLEHKDKERKRFWEIDRAEGSCEVHIRYGKIGAKGTQGTKTFNTPSQAEAYYEKQKSAKLKKDYVLTGSAISTGEVTPAKETQPLAELLCSPSEESQRLGLELIKNLLESDPHAIDVPALLLLSHVNMPWDQSEYSDIRKEAMDLFNKLPKPPKGLGGANHERYVKYICEHGTSGVITRMIRLCMEFGIGKNALIWSDTRLRALPDELAQFPELIGVSAGKAQLTAFPEILFELPNLIHCDFNGSKIPELPPGIAKMQQLKSLDLYENDITELPESIAELENLESLRLEGNPMNAPEQVEKLIEVFHKDKTDIATRRVLISLICARNERACELADVDALIDVLESALPLVRANALIALDMKLEAAYHAAPLAAGAKLAVVGKSGLSAREIKSRLEEYDIGVAGTIKKGTTHVLIGECPGKKRESLRDFKGVLLTESLLTAFLHAQDTPVFLDAGQDTGEEQANIVELLMSEDKDKQLLALEMLKGTGVSRELMTPLYLAYRLATDKKVRGGAKALLLQNASPGFKQMINKNQNFKTASEKAADEYLKEHAGFEEIDVLQLARLYSLRLPVGLNFAFEHGDTDELSALLAGMVDSKGTLDLSNRGLRRLPEEIGTVQAITHLQLADNKLKTLPETLGALKNLENIDVSCNKLTTLPETLGTLPRLARLNALGNRLTRLPGSLGEAPLIELNVSNNNITALPKGFGALKILHASGNRIGVFPKALLDCTHLHELYIERNTLEQWPQDLSALCELKCLNFGWEGMDAPPVQIATLPALERLEVYSQTLNDLPPAWIGLSALTNLSLWKCDLAELPACIPKLVGLEYLHLHGNRLTDLPDAFADLTRLRGLDVSNNQFKDFPGVLLRMSWLDSLDITDNGDFHLPDDLARMSKLTSLWVGGETRDRARELMPASCDVY